MIVTSAIKKIRDEFLRRVIYRHYKIGKGFHAGARVRIWAKSKLEIGDNFYIGRDSFIESNAIIGNNVLFANRVAIVGKYDHNYQEVGIPTRLAVQIRDHHYNWKGLDEVTVIEDDVWVGYNSTILSGVIIREGSIIAAGSIVTKEVEPYSIYAGSPAKKIRDRFNSKQDLHRHLTMIQSKYLNLI